MSHTPFKGQPSLPVKAGKTKTKNRQKQTKRKPKMAETIDIWVDGGCWGNPGPGGWAFGLAADDVNDDWVDSGFESKTTNNRMEMTAAIKALDYLTEIEANYLNQQVYVFTDSRYLLMGITKWIKKWLKTDFKNGKIKNIDLWEKLLNLNFRIRPAWRWVPGHSGIEKNEFVHDLSQQQIKDNCKKTYS